MQKRKLGKSGLEVSDVWDSVAGTELRLGRAIDKAQPIQLNPDERRNVACSCCSKRRKRTAQFTNDELVGDVFSRAGHRDRASDCSEIRFRYRSRRAAAWRAHTAARSTSVKSLKRQLKRLKTDVIDLFMSTPR